ncbi:hypothetical protein G7Y89_g11940 [Cudoniella acicularis]|uniref:NACHT-NTPase and P-loop NTPases N-terminal domain-containing protein n=1 Tax=Cudoniella acicularis TaxID=354080 RepID=A0A8H4VZP3_9HELO|nr:hypothetical protein G7Y89_g11940 [Cudoniella acicularis]
MDPFSASANVVAFVSLAMQLAQSTKQLYDFWGSLKETPKSIRVLADDLRLVDAVLDEIERDARRTEPDETCLKALQSCQALVVNLNDLAEDVSKTDFNLAHLTQHRSVGCSTPLNIHISKHPRSFRNLYNQINIGWTLLGIQSDCISKEWPGKNQDAEIAIFKNALQLLLSYGLLENLNESMVTKLLRSRSPPLLDTLMDTSNVFVELSPTIISKAIYLSDIWFLNGFFKRGADLHQAVLWDGQWNTPNSSAMRSLFDFSAWKGLLDELGINLHDFIQEEMQQKYVCEGSGWTKQSLLRLFEFDILTKRRLVVYCEYCLNDLDDIILVDTVWMQVLSRIMQGFDLSSTPETIRIFTIDRYDLLCFCHRLQSPLETTSFGIGDPILAEASAARAYPPPTQYSRIGFYDQICESCWLHGDPAQPYCYWQYESQWICLDC